MSRERFFRPTVFLTLWHFALWITNSPVFAGKWTREPRPLPQSGHDRRPACRVIGGIDGKSFENEGCMLRELKRLAAEREALAEMEGLTFSSELHRLETSNDFVKFAAKRGAAVKKKGTTYWRVSKGNVWWAFSTSKQKFKKKEVKHVIITAFKAMGIAFAKK
eukprot:s1817_g3.t1